MPPNAGKGRPKGSRNKASAKRQAEIAASGLTPLAYLLQVTRDLGKPDALRIEAAKAAAPYVHPKLSSVEFLDRTPRPAQTPAKDIPDELAEQTYLSMIHESSLN